MNINLQQQLKILLNSSLNIKPTTTGLNCSEEGNLISFMASKPLKPAEELYTLDKDAHTWLSVIVSSLPKATLITDTNRNILITNQLFCTIFNLLKSPEQLAGYNTADLLNDLSSNIEDMIPVAGRIIELYNTRQSADNDEMRLKDGRIIIREHRPLYFKEAFIGHLWTYSDETERINATEQINAQRNFYETILDNIPADIAVFSPDHRYRFVNPVGVKDPALRKWLIGKTDADYCVLRNKSMSIAEGRRALFNTVVTSRKEYTWEEKVVNRNNEDEYHLRKMSPVFDKNGNLELLIGYGMNITERKMIEGQVQHSEKKYRDLFNYSQALICTHDLEGNLIEVNPALCEAMEMPEEELNGKNLKSFLPDQDQGIFDDSYLPAIQTSKKAKGLFRVLSRSGRSIYLLYQNYKVVPDDREQPPYVIAFAQDVTDRIKAEKQLREAKKITEETAKIKEKFLTNMSHEIRVPMNGIVDMVNMLAQTNISFEQQEALQTINRWSGHILTIINDILDLEKASEGKLELTRTNFDLVKEIQSTINRHRDMATAKRLELHVENHLTPSYEVIGDPGRLVQVLDNLLSNALKFTHTGSIVVSADIERESPKEVTLHIAVKDTGIGIAEDKLIKIFQPFAQAYEAGDRKYSGTGLGLTLTKKLVGLQNGSIWVESQPKKGSTFHVHITYQKILEPGSSRHPVAASNEFPNQLGKLKILLAEDNEISQLLARSVLQYWGFESKTALNGIEAIQMLEQEHFDLILMDIQMPGKNGVEATIEIRKMVDESKKNIPIIALTAVSMKGEEQKYLLAGMNDYITKPFKEQELYNVISRVYNSIIR
jgi:PAS domain S-box-containing protein